MKKITTLVKKHRLRVLVGILAVILVLFVTVQLSLNRAGVCVNQGRVLSEVELRQAVLQSLVTIEIENRNIYERIMGHRSSSPIGIIRNPRELDVLKLMEESVHSDKTFKMNFKIEEITPEFDVERLEEPFMLVNYDDSKYDGTAVFYVSSEIQQIDRPEQIKKLKNKYTLSLFERLQGFGEYYFHIPQTFSDRGCCDNRVPKNKRKEIYLGSLRSINLDLKKPKRFVLVSNCGELLTFREKDTNLDLQSIIWIQGE